MERIGMVWNRGGIDNSGVETNSVGVEWKVVE